MVRITVVCAEMVVNYMYSSKRYLSTAAYVVLGAQLKVLLGEPTGDELCLMPHLRYVCIILRS